MYNPFAEPTKTITSWSLARVSKKTRQNSECVIANATMKSLSQGRS